MAVAQQQPTINLPANYFSQPQGAGSGMQGQGGFTEYLPQLAGLLGAILPFILGSGKGQQQIKRPNVPKTAGYTQTTVSEPQENKLVRALGTWGQMMMMQQQQKKQRQQALEDAEMQFGKQMALLAKQGEWGAIKQWIADRERADRDAEKRTQKEEDLLEERKYREGRQAEQREYDASIAGTKEQTIKPTMSGLMELLTHGADPKVLADKFKVPWLADVWDEKIARRARAAEDIEQAKDILDISRMGMRAYSDLLKSSTFASATPKEKEDLRKKAAATTEAYNIALQKVVSYGGKDLSPDQWEEVRKGLENARQNLAGKEVDEIEQIIQERWTVEEDGAMPMFITDYYLDKIYPLVLEISQSQ